MTWNWLATLRERIGEYNQDIVKTAPSQLTTAPHYKHAYLMFFSSYSPRVRAHTCYQCTTCLTGGIDNVLYFFYIGCTYKTKKMLSSSFAPDGLRILALFMNAVIPKTPIGVRVLTSALCNLHYWPELKWIRPVCLHRPAMHHIRRDISTHGVHVQRMNEPCWNSTQRRYTHSRPGEPLRDKWEQCIGLSTGMTALTALVKQSVNASFRTREMIVNKMLIKCRRGLHIFLLMSTGVHWTGLTCTNKGDDRSGVMDYGCRVFGKAWFFRVQGDSVGTCW